MCWSKGSTRHSNPTGHRAAAPTLLVRAHVGRGPSCLAFMWRLVFAEASAWPRHKPSLFQITACGHQRDSRKHLVQCLFLNNELVIWIRNLSPLSFLKISFICKKRKLIKRRVIHLQCIALHCKWRYMVSPSRLDSQALWPGTDFTLL